MITMAMEDFEYIELISQRLADRWDYKMSDAEFDAMQKYFAGATDVKHHDYVADNYYVNADKGDGEDLLSNRPLKDIPEYLDQCCFVWNRYLVDEILADEYLDDSEKKEKIKDLGCDEFGYCYNIGS